MVDTEDQTFDQIVSAMADDDDKRQWAELGKHSLARAVLIGELAKRNRDLGPDDKIGLNYRMAAVDSFVEKAIIHLSARASKYERLGQISVAGFVIFLTVALILALQADPVAKLENLNNQWQAIGYLMSRLTVTGFIVAGLYATFAFSVSFFDEALKAYGRRHSMRWARLYIWLNHGEADPKVLAEYFGVSYDGKTAFSRVKADTVARSWMSHISDLASGNKKKIEELEEMLREHLHDPKAKSSK